MLTFLFIFASLVRAAFFFAVIELLIRRPSWIIFTGAKTVWTKFALMAGFVVIVGVFEILRLCSYQIAIEQGIHYGWHFLPLTLAVAYGAIFRRKAIIQSWPRSQ